MLKFETNTECAVFSHDILQTGGSIPGAQKSPTHAEFTSEGKQHWSAWTTASAFSLDKILTVRRHKQVIISFTETVAGAGWN